MRRFVRFIKSARNTVALLGVVFVASSMSLRADSSCIGECGGQAQLSGFEDVQLTSSFDLFFDPDIPILFIAPSDFASDLNAKPFEGDGDGQLYSILTKFFHLPPYPGTQDPSDPSPDDPPPAATPEPRYSTALLLGLGWAGLAAFRMRKPRGEVRAS
jgi:hypothetical protein